MWNILHVATEVMLHTLLQFYMTLLERLICFFLFHWEWMLVSAVDNRNILLVNPHYDAFQIFSRQCITST